MSTKNQLMKEVRANPDDDEPRLVLADWLEERGDDYGTFIRAQCELAQLAADDDRYPQLEVQAEDLFIKNRTRWIKELPKYDGLSWGSHDQAVHRGHWSHKSVRSRKREYFTRGFVESASVKGNRSLKANISKIKKYGLLNSLELLKPIQAAYDLYAKQKYIRGISFFRFSLPIGYLDSLSFRDKLRTLTVAESDNASRLGESVFTTEFPKLQALDVSASNLKGSLPEFLKWKSLSGLKWLNLGKTHLKSFSEAEFKKLIELKTLSSLSTLDMWSSLGAKQVELFVKHGSMKRLTRLSLASNRFGDAGFAPLANAKFKKLHTLDIRWNALTSKSVQLMEGSTVFRNLYRLNLCGNRKICDQAAKALAGSDTFKNLTHLNLGLTSITEKGIKDLLNSQNLNEIRWLNIGGTEVAPATLKQLKKRFPKAIVQDPHSSGTSL